ncbi:phage host specificity protein [Escherichia coli]|nr:phage host specificity protein [Escherichia coli]
MGKGSSKGHTPREAKDNLKSTQLLSVIDAISEGPIEGPVDGLKSVLLNSTPVLDSEGNTNIAGVTVVFRAGEQEQTPPEGFESSGSETVLGTEVKYDTPITRTITSANINRLRFTFGVQALVETTSKGDRNPSEVRLLVQIQRNGGWVTEKDITIKGKTTSQYLASVVVGNLPPRPFSIRMRRMTPDSTYAAGASMILGGVAQMLAPKARTPTAASTDNGKQNTYFSSLDNMVAQGNVLPVLYGEMRVGSRVVSQEISTADEGDGGQVVVIGR